MRRSYLAAIAVAGVLTCEAPTWAPPAGTRQLETVPAGWRDLWDYAGRCPGIPARSWALKDVRFYVAPESSLVWDGARHAGAWLPPHDVYLEHSIVDEPLDYYRRLVIVHELLHDGAQTDGHPSPPFAPGSAGTVDQPDPRGCDFRVP